MRNKKKKVIVLMSGGVDSSVALHILKLKDYDCIGVTLKLWGKDLCGSHGDKSCCSLDSIDNARSIAHSMGVPYYVINLEKEFKERVIDYFCRAYECATTPNPCIVCNEKIKFDLSINKLKALNADYIASGHYARVFFDKKKKKYYIKESVDKKKDQSYVLFSLGQDVLRRLLLPLGGMRKEKVRLIARKANLKVHDKLDSQEICFVPDDNYAKFVMSRSKFDLLPGPIVTLEGKLIGEHRGLIHYTIGQRRGLGIAYKEPLYVLKFVPAENKIIVGTKNDTFKKVLTANKTSWVDIFPVKPIRAKAKIRYNHKKTDALITGIGADEIRVEFKTPQSSPTPGQAVVFYKKDLVIGGGWINEVI